MEETDEYKDYHLPGDYLLWQKRLAAEFFAGREGQPVVMFVDLDELQGLADLGEDALRSLSSAVLGIVGTRRGMFSTARIMMSTWRLRGRQHPPPVLPILALSVIAATEMRKDSKGATHNYYVRLASLMLPDGSEEEVESLRHLLAAGQEFQHVAQMWEQVRRWLDDADGTFGISTIPASPRPSRIGYPLSQALLRRTDRAALTKFFDRLLQDHEDLPDAEALLGLLRVWARSPSRGFSATFRQVLGGAEADDTLRPLVHDLAVAWDGRVLTADGLRRLDIRLALDLDRSEAWWVIPDVKSFSGDIVSGTAGDTRFTAILTPDEYSDMLATEGLPPVSEDSLAKGIIARGDHSAAVFNPAQLFVMADSADAGGWVSVEAIQPYEEHVLVAASDTQASVEEAVRRAADPGWRRLSSQAAKVMLGGGYTVFWGVVFSDGNALQQALRALPVRVADQIQVGSAARPRLVRGLPLHTNLSRNTYLSGGEPDLELPVGSEARDVEVTLDGIPEVFRTRLFPIPFSVFRLEPGEHTVGADGETLSFVVEESAGPAYVPPGAGKLAWRGGRLAQDQQSHDVCGAWTGEAEDPPMVLVRRGALENWLLSSTGRATRVTEPPQPDLDPRLICMYFEVPGDSSVWLLQKRPAGWRVIRLRSDPPSFGTVPPASRAVWAEAVASVNSDDQLWARYVNAWEDTEDGR